MRMCLLVGACKSFQLVHKNSTFETHVDILDKFKFVCFSENKFVRRNGPGFDKSIDRSRGVQFHKIEKSYVHFLNSKIPSCIKRCYHHMSRVRFFDCRGTRRGEVVFSIIFLLSIHSK